MGRETKFLLALLGLLGGVFLGVVSLKLFVPRPPAGAGPDVHADVAASDGQDLVEPPHLLPPATSQAPPEADVPFPASRFAAAAPARDPFVAPAAFEQVVDLPPAAAEPPAPSTTQHEATIVAEAAVVPPPAPPAAAEPSATPSPPATGGVYIAQPGDSWWSLAERHYGDGRFYRALFAWNRSIDPRISLAPGSRLEIPPVTHLRLARPTLLPAD